METQVVTDQTVSQMIARMVELKEQIKELNALKEEQSKLKAELYKRAIEAGNVDSKGRPVLERYTGSVYFTTTSSQRFNVKAATEALGADILAPFMEETKSVRAYPNGKSRV